MNASAYLVPFNQPCLVGHEMEYVTRAADSEHISGDGALVGEVKVKGVCLLVHRNVKVYGNGVNGPRTEVLAATYRTRGRRLDLRAWPGAAPQI